MLVTIVAAKFVYDATAYTGEGPDKQPWAQDTMEFVAWNGERWTAWIRDGVFEQRPQNAEKWSGHANASVAFVDWEGRPWQAKIDGDDFLLSHRGDWKSSAERANAIRYRDWEGQNQLRTPDQLRR